MKQKPSLNNIKLLTEKIIMFRDARDWKQFHNPKDMSISLALEAAELMEHFQWKNADEIKTHVEKNREKISEEIADVFYWVLLMSNDLGIDIEKTLKRKISLNSKKYPVKKSKGNHSKYTEL